MKLIADICKYGKVELFIFEDTFAIATIDNAIFERILFVNALMDD